MLGRGNGIAVQSFGKVPEQNVLNVKIFLAFWTISVTLVLLTKKSCLPNSTQSLLAIRLFATFDFAGGGEISI